MDELFKILGETLRKLDPRTTLVITVLAIVIWALVYSVNRILKKYIEKEAEVTALHRANKEDSNANIRLIIELSNNIDRHIEQSNVTNEALTKVLDVVKELKVKFDLIQK